MTLKDALQQYVNKELTAIELIGDMTGMINPDNAIDLLALINQITRIERGTMELAIFKDMLGLK